MLKIFRKINRKNLTFFLIASAVYSLFVFWCGNYWLLFGILILSDVFLFGFVPWNFLEKEKEPPVNRGSSLN